MKKFLPILLITAITLGGGLAAYSQQCIGPDKFSACVEAKKILNQLAEGSLTTLTKQQAETLSQCPEISFAQSEPDAGQCIGPNKFMACVEAKKVLIQVRETNSTRLTPTQLAVLDQCPEISPVTTSPQTSPVKKSGISKWQVLDLMLQVAPMLMPTGGGGGHTAAPCPTSG